MSEVQQRVTWFCDEGIKVKNNELDQITSQLQILGGKKQQQKKNFILIVGRTQ